MPITPSVSAGTTSHSFSYGSGGSARSASELPSAATGVTPWLRAYWIARSTDLRNARWTGSLEHLYSCDSWKALSSTKKLMLMTSNFWSPAYVIPSTTALT